MASCLRQGWGCSGVIACNMSSIWLKLPKIFNALSEFVGTHGNIQPLATIQGLKC